MELTQHTEKDSTHTLVTKINIEIKDKISRNKTSSYGNIRYGIYCRTELDETTHLPRKKRSANTNYGVAVIY